MMKRILSLLLTAAFLCGVSGCRIPEPAPENTYHTELSFPDLTDSGINASLEIARAGELLFRVERGELSGIRAQEMLDAREDALYVLQTDAAIAYVRYCLDVADEANKKAYDDLAAQTDALACILVDVALLLSEDPALKDRYDAETVETLKTEDALSDLAVLLLSERERALVGAYEALPGKLAVEYKGRSWTGDEILSDPALSEEDFAALYESYLDLFNAEAGAIFLELADVRREIADELGFGSYADYRYAYCGRDYTPEDAVRFSECVQTELVPLFRKVQSDYFLALGQLYGAAFEQEPTMGRIGAAVEMLFSELSEPWDYMISHGMYHLGTNAERMPGSFTTYFASYGAPFLFGSWTGGFDAIPTVIHEFGHYASFYLNGNEARSSGSLDLAEIDAQGLELLTVLRYDTLYGELAEAAETAELFYALYTLIDGCVEDAFQQFAYAQEDLTLDALNAEYGRLLEVFGLDMLGSEGRSWTQIPHTFRAPFYYISYAASMTVALEMYLMGKTDTDAACKAYHMILSRPDNAAFSALLKEAGLSNPFDPDSIIKTACDLDQILCSRRENGLDGESRKR